MGFSSPCFASLSPFPSCIENGNVKYTAPKSSDNTLRITFNRFSRRLVLQFVGLSHLWIACPILAAPMMPEMKEPEVLRRANGYFVYSTVDQFSGESKPVILPLDENQMIEGLKEVLTGMRVGGKRRALVPPSVGYLNENLQPVPEEFGPRRSLFSHAKEPLVFEVQLLKVSSLPSTSVF